MPSYRTEAIVLRTHKLGEADRIITMLTKDRGKIRAVAKGVRRTKSRFGARLEPFSRVDVLVHEGKSLDIVQQAELITPFGQAMTIDYGMWTAGQTMVETADRLTSEESISSESQYVLLAAALRTLTSSEHDSTLVLDSYLLRSLSLAGYSPSLDACVVCGDTQAPFFSVGAGGAMCVDHRAPGSVAPKEETFDLLKALLVGDWQYADNAAVGSQREVSGIISAYVQWHLERALRSLPHVDRSMTGLSNG